LSISYLLVLYIYPVYAFNYQWCLKDLKGVIAIAAIALVDCQLAQELNVNGFTALATPAFGPAGFASSLSGGDLGANP
jgi:hypothetical protein